MGAKPKGEINMQFLAEKKKPVEFRIVDDEELPPIIFTQNENDEVKVVINTYHKIWICLNRRTILGALDALGEKIDTILTSHLSDQRMFEKQDREMI
tara:strand:+ start:1548 stop:1838 length:291 start_codon:yes stop_codon:yes gene_type:complete